MEKRVPPVLASLAEREVSFLLGRLEGGQALCEEECDEGIEQLRKATRDDDLRPNASRKRRRDDDIASAAPEAAADSVGVAPEAAAGSVGGTATPPRDTDAAPDDGVEAGKISADDLFGDFNDGVGDALRAGDAGDDPPPAAPDAPDAAAVPRPVVAIPAPVHGINEVPAGCRLSIQAPWGKTPFWIAHLPKGERHKGKISTQRCFGTGTSEAVAKLHCWTWLQEWAATKSGA